MVRVDSFLLRVSEFLLLSRESSVRSPAFLFTPTDVLVVVSREADQTKRFGR
jgi:hypothetical protein